MYWGTSEWPAAQIQQAQHTAERLGLVGPAAEQPSYSIIERKRVENEYQPLYKSASGLGTTIYSPLASGVLTGKYNDGIPDNSRFTVESYSYIKEAFFGGKHGAWQGIVNKIKRLVAVADELGATPAQLAVAWCLRNRDVSTVLLGASKLEQLQENIGAIHVLDRLSSDVLGRIDSIFGNAPPPPPTNFVAKALKKNFRAF